MPVTPRCMPPREENERPAADTMRSLGENEIRCEGKNAGGRVLSSDSSPDVAARGPPVALGVKSSLREKSTPCHGSAGDGVGVGGSAGVESARGKGGCLLRGSAGSSAGIAGHEAEGEMRLLGTATGGGASGGGRQNEPADEDGVMAHEVASLQGEVGHNGESAPVDVGDGGHWARSSRSAQGSRDRGRASAAAARSAMSKGFLATALGRNGRRGAASLAWAPLVLAVASRALKCMLRRASDPSRRND